MTQPTAPPAAIATLRQALDKATLVDDDPAYILGKLLDALGHGGWRIDRACGCSARFTRHADGCPALPAARSAQTPQET